LFSVLQVIGGLALFLYGMRLLSNGMEKLAGNRIQEWLDRMTSTPIRGAFFGFVATAIIRSSGLLMVTMISLINANLMTLEQAVGVMMGQEIGTTITAQIVAFHIGDLCFIFIALGLVMIEFAPRPSWRDYGEISLGFGALFLGMNLMADALKILAELPTVSTWLAMMGQNLLAGVLAGTVATAIVQSSSATTSLVVAMGMSQTITLPAAIALILGANIGSCVMGLLASARLSKASRQASMAQILINVIGVLLFLPFISPFASLVSQTSSALARQIANAHTFFNVTVSVALFPFVRYIARAARLLVPQSAEHEKPKLTAYIENHMHRFPAVALAEALRELVRIGERSAQMLERSRQALVENDALAVEWVLEQESEFVDPLCFIFETFVNTLMQESLSVSQQKRCFQFKHLLTDIERVADLAEDLAETAQKIKEHHVTFSAEALQELDRLCQHAHRTYSFALQALQDSDKALARRACRLEDEFDELYLEARQAHIRRLDEGVCSPEAGVMFVEVLRNLERVSDHADNLGVSVSRN
jgi:phosphate:Na+ symporter